MFSQKNIQETVSDLPNGIANIVEEIALEKENGEQEHYSKQIDQMWKRKTVLNTLNYGDAYEFSPDTVVGQMVGKYLRSRSKKDPEMGIIYSKEEFEQIPKVQEIMKQVDDIQGTPLEVLEKVYNLVSNKLLHPSRLKDGDHRLHSNPREDITIALKEGVGDCNLQSLLICHALEQKGFETDLVSAPGHVWLRVSVEDPATGNTLEFDLEPSMDGEFHVYRKQRSAST